MKLTIVQIQKIVATYGNQIKRQPNRISQDSLFSTENFICNTPKIENLKEIYRSSFYKLIAECEIIYPSFYEMNPAKRKNVIERTLHLFIVEALMNKSLTTITNIEEDVIEISSSFTSRRHNTQIMLIFLAVVKDNNIEVIRYQI